MEELEKLKQLVRVNAKGPRLDQWQGGCNSCTIPIYNNRRKCKKSDEAATLQLHFQSHRRFESNPNQQI